jgi:DNA-binding SARP family transcriptional activator
MRDRGTAENIGLRILGPVECRRGGTRIDLYGTKLRTALAAMLLARGRVLWDTELAAVLWGSQPPRTAYAQIYSYISRLRRLFGQAVCIERRGSGYALRLGGAWLDYAEFQGLAGRGHDALRDGEYALASGQLRAALDLWPGTALIGVTEFLLEAELPRLAEERVAVVESRIAADLMLGRNYPLVPELTALVQAHPLRERLRALLMTALYASGRQAEAFEAYRVGRDLLSAELGVDPSAVLDNAFRGILAGELSVPRGATPVDGVAGCAPSRWEAVARVGAWSELRPAMLPPPTADFAGRETELARLCHTLRAPRALGPVVVSGMAGVGKSTLAIQAGRQIGNEFPDGQLWVDFAAGHDSRVTGALPGARHLPARTGSGTRPGARIPVRADTALPQSAGRTAHADPAGQCGRC